jgi:heterodisulfide reductase subunit B
VTYLYYPGCSLKCSGRSYEESLLPVFEKAGLRLSELPDWNCCGATAYMSVDEFAAFRLALRNLALAERNGGAEEGPIQMVAPCAACYLVLLKAQHRLAEYPQFALEAGADLAAVGLAYAGRVRVRHPLDVLLNDVGLGKLRPLIRNPLSGLQVACYYGCQLVRPYADFDDQDRPTTMDRLMELIGARPIDWPLKTHCCGGTLPGTIRDVGVRLVDLLIEDAARRGAEVVVTACPLCQFNLDCHQRHPRASGGARRAALPILYFTQLLGLAFGLPARQLGLERHIVPLRPALAGAPGGSRD